MRVRGSSHFRGYFAAISAGLGLTIVLATASAGAEEATRASPPEPVLIDLGLHLGGVYRLEDAPAFAITGRAGAVFGASAYVAPSRRYALGLGFEHVGLGGEHAEEISGARRSRGR